MLKTVMEKREKRPQAEQTEQALRGTRGNEVSYSHGVTRVNCCLLGESGNRRAGPSRAQRTFWRLHQYVESLCDAEFMGVCLD